jgi:hypothetical protein
LRQNSDVPCTEQVARALANDFGRQFGMTSAHVNGVLAELSTV